MYSRIMIGILKISNYLLLMTRLPSTKWKWKTKRKFKNEKFFFLESSQWFFIRSEKSFIFHQFRFTKPFVLRMLNNVQTCYLRRTASNMMFVFPIRLLQFLFSISDIFVFHAMCVAMSRTILPKNSKSFRNENIMWTLRDNDHKFDHYLSCFPFAHPQYVYIYKGRWNN